MYKLVIIRVRRHLKYFQMVAVRRVILPKKAALEQESFSFGLESA